MVKQKSRAYLAHNHNMNAYKMRTPYGGPKVNSRQNPPQPNRVQVAQSNGCCSSSKEPQQVPSKPVTIQHETPRETAHDRSHSKLDPPNPYYFSRVHQKPNRTKKPYYQQNGKNKIHVTGPKTTSAKQLNTKPNPVQHPAPPPTTTNKKSSCCTIL
jgi:hypothetical protein